MSRPTSTGGATGAVLRGVAHLCPVDVDAGEELTRSLAFLGAGVDAPTVVRAGFAAGAFVGVAVLTTAALLGVPTVPALAGGVAVAVGVAHAIHGAPVTLATMRRTSALGEAPDLIGRAVLRMRVAPSVEAAASFAAETGEGPLAASLAAHVARSRGTPRSGLGGFAAEWADWFPALRRAALLVESATEAPPAERARALDRATTAALDGTRDRMASFASEIRGPATGVYAFGVLLPLALVSVLPAARAAGLPASVTAVVVGYDVLLPVGLAWASWRLLAKRPVAFRPPSVPPSHPEVRDRRWAALAVGAVAGVAAWFAADRLVAGWAGPLAAAGWGPGVALLWWYAPVKRVRDRVRAVETHLPDALYLVGRRVADGAAVEAAVEAAADEVADPTGRVLADAARRGRLLRIGLREAFLGEHGPLAGLPSARTRSSAAVLALAAREGRPAGDAAVAMADHLEALLDVEREARRSLARVTDTLASTAVLFGPLVGGATVALSRGVGGATGAVEPLPVAGLGLAIGAYVLVLSALLTGLSVGLARGLDRALVGYRCGVALPVAVAVYLLGYLAAGTAV